MSTYMFDETAHTRFGDPTSTKDLEEQQFSIPLTVPKILYIPEQHRERFPEQ